MIDPGLQHPNQTPQSNSTIGGSFYLNPHAMLANGDGLMANGAMEHQQQQQQQPNDAMTTPSATSEIGESVSSAPVADELSVNAPQLRNLVVEGGKKSHLHANCNKISFIRAQVIRKDGRRQRVVTRSAIRSGAVRRGPVAE